MGLHGPSLKSSKGRSAHPVSVLSGVCSKLATTLPRYADVRLHIPMTHLVTGPSLP